MPASAVEFPQLGERLRMPAAISCRCLLAAFSTPSQLLVLILLLFPLLVLLLLLLPNCDPPELHLIVNVSASPWCIGKIFAIARQNRAKNSKNNNSSSREQGEGIRELGGRAGKSAENVGIFLHVHWLLLAHNVGYWLRLAVTSLVNRICCGRWQ